MESKLERVRNAREEEEKRAHAMLMERLAEEKLQAQKVGDRKRQLQEAQREEFAERAEAAAKRDLEAKARGMEKKLRELMEMRARVEKEEARYVHACVWKCGWNFSCFPPTFS